MNVDPLAVASSLGRVFDELGVRYLVGGSVASSVHGVFRFTADVDMVAELRDVHVASFVAKIESEFDVDAAMIRDAIEHRGSFNVLHRVTAFKADVFMPLRSLEPSRTATGSTHHDRS